VSDFGIQLVSSLHAFKLAGKTCCWLTVPLDFAHFIPVAAHQVCGGPLRRVSLLGYECMI
jgi:hypothetical protein